MRDYIIVSVLTKLHDFRPYGIFHTTYLNKDVNNILNKMPENRFGGFFPGLQISEDKPGKCCTAEGTDICGTGQRKVCKWQ